MRLQVPALSTDQGRHCKSLAERILSALGKTKPTAAAAAFFFFFFCCPSGPLYPRIYRMVFCGYFPAQLGNLSERLVVGPTVLKT